MTFGAEPKKIALLAVLGAVAVYSLYVPAAPVGQKAAPRVSAPARASAAALRDDLLERLRGVRLRHASRSLFEFSLDKPPVPTPTGRPELRPTPQPPSAPAYPLKFYGFVKHMKAGTRKAFFLEGDEIHIAGEGDIIKERYRLVRIDVNSVLVEDTQLQDLHTLRLEEQAG
jgi:hypothetical protein